MVRDLVLALALAGQEVRGRLGGGGGAGAEEQSLSLSSRDDGMRGTWGVNRSDWVIFSGGSTKLGWGCNWSQIPT